MISNTHTQTPDFTNTRGTDQRCCWNVRLILGSFIMLALLNIYFNIFNKSRLSRWIDRENKTLNFPEHWIKNQCLSVSSFHLCASLLDALDWFETSQWRQWAREIRAMLDSCIAPSLLRFYSFLSGWHPRQILSIKSSWRCPREAVLYHSKW